MANYRLLDAADKALLATASFDNGISATAWAQNTAESHVPKPLEWLLEKQDVDGSWVFCVRAGRTSKA